MAAETATLCCTLLFVGVFVFVSGEQKIITAGPGQNVTLTCRAPNNNILGVKWSRADLGSEYVLLYRDGLLDPDNQHPSFKNRVDLQDRQMKDGDVSVILKNVTINDEGTYECRVFIGETRLWKSIINITLRVVAPPPGPTEGTTEDGGKEDGGKEEDGFLGLIVGLSVSALLLVVVVAALVGFVIYRKHKNKPDEASYLPPPEQQQG